MSDIREATVISVNGNKASVRPLGSNSTLRNIPVSSGSVSVGQKIQLQTVQGKRIVIGGSGEVSGGSSASLNIVNNSVTNVTNNGVELTNILSSATYHGDLVNTQTLTKVNSDGFIAFGRTQIGNSQKSYDPNSNWKDNNLTLISNSQSGISFSTQIGVLGITSNGEEVKIADNFGFGYGVTNLSGNTLVSPLGAVGTGNFPSSPLTGYGDSEQLRLVYQANGRYAVFMVNEFGDLRIGPQNRRTSISGVIQADSFESKTASIARLRTGSLLVDRQSVLCGETIAAERGAFIAFDFTVPVAGQETSLIIEEPIESTANVFRDGSYILLSKIIWTDSTTYIRKKCWGKVTFQGRLPGGSPPMQEYMFIRDADIPGDLEAGEIIAHDGVSNIAIQFGKDSGLYMITTTGGTSTPSVVIYSWTGHPENPTNLKKQLETSSNKVIVSDLTFTGNGISTSFGPKLYFGAYSDNQYYYAVGIETQVSEAADYGGAAVFMKAWDYGRTDWCGIVADRSIFEKRLSFNADTYAFANTAHLYSSGFVFHSQTSFEKMLRLPAVEVIFHPFGNEYNSRLRIDVSSHDPLVKADGDLWLLLSGLKFHLNGATRNILAPSSIPVLPTGAGKTVDDVIVALQAIGAVTQT